MRSREEVDKEDGRKSRDSGLPAFKTGTWEKEWYVVRIVWIDMSYQGAVNHELLSFLSNALAFPCALSQVNSVILRATSCVPNMEIKRNTMDCHPSQGPGCPVVGVGPGLRCRYGSSAPCFGSRSGLGTSGWAVWRSRVRECGSPVNRRSVQCFNWELS